LSGPPASGAMRAERAVPTTKTPVMADVDTGLG
jgi:hypothetical protein